MNTLVSASGKTPPTLEEVAGPRSLPLHVSLKVQSDDQGEYVSPPLRIGLYAVRAEAQGFKSQTKENVTLQVQDRLRLDHDMVIGSARENVMVSGRAAPIQTETSSLGQVANSQQITDLPLNGRDYLQLATLTTGVMRTSSVRRAAWSRQTKLTSPPAWDLQSPLDSGNSVIRRAYGILYSGQEIRTVAPLQLAYNIPFFSRPSFISDGITPILTVS